MAAQPDDLLPSAAVGHLERASMSRAPYRLNHVPEVEAGEPEVEIVGADDREERERPAEHRRPDDEDPALRETPREHARVGPPPALQRSRARPGCHPELRPGTARPGGLGSE